MKANDKLQELMNASAQELEAAETELATFAKAEGAETEAAPLDIDEPEGDAATDEDEDENEDEEGEAAADEGDLEGVFGKAQTATADEVQDATPILASIAENLTGMRAELAAQRSEISALRAENAVLAKAQAATIRGTANLVKAQQAAMGMPLKPKSVVIPTGKVAKAQPAVNADTVFAKAIEAVERKEITAGDIGVFQALTAQYGLDKALEIKPEFQSFAQ